ncbi:hypothetical protein METP3_00270 [Methanosarcinales archaeon]|nr:hypothetical protein METP3_00270 [Methanosarcinales archaeon]
MQNKQSKNAGNRGDRLKHAILLEILDYTIQNNIWSYRESHAGAGYYDLNEHSMELLNFLSTNEKNNLQGVGQLYGQILKQWWIKNTKTYPGSIALASEILYRNSKSLDKIDIRATEVDIEAFTRLYSLKSEFNLGLKNESFDTNLDWLCEGSSMVFLIDPFFYDINVKMQSGGFGREQLINIFKNLSIKKAAVLIIFTSYIERSHKKTYEDLKMDISNHLPPKSVARHFITTRKKNGKTYYWISVIGFGDGVKIVKGLHSDWNKSWLASKEINTLIKEVNEIYQ